MSKHLAIYDSRELINKVFQGVKTIDGRFSTERTVPYEKIKKGDLILLKLSGGKILGEVRVANVLFYDHLEGERIGRLRKEYGKELAVDNDFWQRYRKAKYASIIFLTNPERYLIALKYPKHDRRGWVVLE